MKYYITIIAVLLTACGGGSSLPANFQSWYVPGYGTVNINYGQPSEVPRVTYGALSTDVIVLSDIGSSVDYINQDGSTRWRHYDGGRIRGLHVWGDGSIAYVSGPTLNILDTDTGELLESLQPLNESLSDLQRIDGGFIAATADRVHLLDESYGITWTNPHAVTYPRSAIKVGQVVIIADTFGHRVYGVDIDTGVMLWQYEEYFPNMVVDVGGDVLIVGEHSNRVYLLDPDTGARDPVYSCDIYPFNDPYSTVSTITDMEHDPLRPLLIDPDSPELSKSVCAGLLYSPNGAATSGTGGYFIASTDDGEVLEIDQYGAVSAVISGFNNPAQVLAVPE